MSNDAKKLILARRAKFVAAALAGLAVACGKEQKPEPCLALPMNHDAATSPGPCLAAPLDWKERWDAGAADASAHDAAPSTTSPVTPFDASAPMPCLSIVAPPPDAGAKKK